MSSVPADYWSGKQTVRECGLGRGDTYGTL